MQKNQILTQDEILKIFIETGVMLKGHFLLTSGRHSDTYMQCAKLFTNAQKSELIVSELAKKLTGIKADTVISPAVGGILFGYELSRALKIKNIFAERENGTFVFRRGFELTKGERVIVAEDTVTTGGSVKEVIELAKNSGAEVVAVASIVDRSNGKTDFGVPFYNLLSMDIKSYPAEECPLCKTMGAPVKPGSRQFK